MTGRPLQQILSGARHLFLDFDGPVCSVYAGTPASTVADQLRRELQAAGITVPPGAVTESDPLEIFRAVAETCPDHAAEAQQILTTLEVQASTTARPAPGSAELIITARRTGRTVTIVSNNSSAAIAAYLDAHKLKSCIQAIYGRDGDNPELMKPNPYQVREAVTGLSAEPGECVLVGDSPADVIAGRLAGIHVIGYASKPGKAASLEQAQADAVTTRLTEISAGLRSASPISLPN